MKVAIIGAGLSGLACGHELLRHGITPTIFERKSYLGEVLDIPVIILDMFNMPIRKPLKYFKKNFNLNIKPNFHLKEIIMHSENNNLTVKSDLGFIIKRGKYADGFESQIMKGISLPINFNSYIDIKDIKNDFEYIVVATGTPNVAKDLNIYKSTFDCVVRVATIKGNFNVNSMEAWMNTVFAKNAYAYLVPNSPKDARLILTVNNVYPNELDYYWKKFLETIKSDYNITNLIDLRHDVGHVSPVYYDKKILFCGNSGGFLDDLLGFGSMKAVTSGLIAGKTIAEKRNYNKVSQKLTEDIDQMHRFRRTINTFENKDYDNMLTVLGLPVIKQYVYHNPFFKATQGVRFAQIYNLFKSR